MLPEKDAFLTIKTQLHSRIVPGLEEFLGIPAATPRTRPYGDLHIYVINGEIASVGEHCKDTMLAAWIEDGVTVIIFESPHETEVRELVDEHPETEYLWHSEMSYHNWEAARPLAPLFIAGFLVRPPWETAPPHSACNNINEIVIDAGLSFGSGFHPTTQSSISLLKSAFDICIPETVLDLGCGSGILSVGAALLGARKITAIDYSLLAANATRINCELNGVADSIDIHLGDAIEFLSRPADLVLCNINHSVLFDMISKSEFFNPEQIVVSGIHREAHNRRFLEELASSGHEISRCIRRGEWYSYLISKRVR